MKHIGWIAVGGLAVGIVASALAGVVGDNGNDQSARHWARQFRHFPWNPRGWNEMTFSDDEDCFDGTTPEAKTSERHIPWDDGDALTIALPANVHYRGGEGTELIVRGEPEAVARVHVGAGKITASCGGLHGDVDITLPGRAFDSILLKKSAHLTMENIHQPELTVDVAGSGSAGLSGAADEMHASIHGSGKITLADLTMKKLELSVAGSGAIGGTGKSDSAEISIAGSGKADLGEVPMNDVEISVAGSGAVTAAPKDKADVSIMGSGKVTFMTHPAHVNTSIMGSGQVVEAPAKGKET
jgi:hypothetical protein